MRKIIQKIIKNFIVFSLIFLVFSYSSAIGNVENEKIPLVLKMKINKIVKNFFSRTEKEIKTKKEQIKKYESIIKLIKKITSKNKNFQQKALFDFLSHKIEKKISYLNKDLNFSENSNNIKIRNGGFSFSGSKIDNIEKNFDTSPLLGSWKLLSQTTISPVGSMLHPFSGRTLTFKNNGKYVEDYSTEETEDINVANPTMNFTNHCEVSGIITGKYSFEESIADLDTNEFHNELYITKDNYHSKPKVICGASTSSYTNKSSLASLTLGIGTADITKKVTYNYTLNDDENILTITLYNHHTNVKIVYVFQKI